jgi:origin recognition complex subunit 3
LRNYLESQGNNRVIVALQDSEAFETSILVDLISLFQYVLLKPSHSVLIHAAPGLTVFPSFYYLAWLPRLSFSRKDSQTSSVLERIFQVAIASSGAVLRVGPEVLSVLMERQLDHLQGVQSFISAIKVNVYESPVHMTC